MLGAGPAGMSAAWRLSELGYPVTVLDRNDAVGGMARTITVGKSAAKYAVDFGPHTFHIRDTDESRAILKAIARFFGDDPLMLTRGTRVLLRGKEYVYPLEMMQVLTGVSPLLSARIVFDYLIGHGEVGVRAGQSRALVRGMGRAQPRAVRSTTCALASTRRGCGGCRPVQISSKQAQRVAKLNLKNIILRTLGIKADPATYFTKYMYPRKGISLLYDGMADDVRRAGNRVCLESPVVRLERRGRPRRPRRLLARQGRSTRSTATSCSPRCRCRRWCR